MPKNIEILVRAVIQNKGKILVCQKIGKDYRGKDYYFFPGGHMEFGEGAKEALRRELKEELGLEIKKTSFIGGSEHLFKGDGGKHHEINLVFDAQAYRINVVSKEDHLRFFLFNKKELAQKNFLPAVIKKAILKWLKDKKMFWTNGLNK